MGKLIKLKQSDIENIVKNVIKEQEDEFNDEMGGEETDDIDVKYSPNGLILGQDKDGNYYFVTQEGDIVLKTR